MQQAPFVRTSLGFALGERGRTLVEGYRLRNAPAAPRDVRARCPIEGIASKLRIALERKQRCAPRVEPAQLGDGEPAVLRDDRAGVLERDPGFEMPARPPIGADACSEMLDPALEERTVPTRPILLREWNEHALRVQSRGEPPSVEAK